MEKLNKLYNAVFEEVMALPDKPHAGLTYWRKKKLSLSTQPLTNLEWIVIDENFDPYNTNGEFYIDDSWTVSVATPLHFTNQLKRIPLITLPSERKIMQMALNSAQAVRSGLQEYKLGFHDVVNAKT
tara:strand:+ start:745 stop:1125 length:381 start_codon:yes stop_codon:yes gene_type:complete